MNRPQESPNFCRNLTSDSLQKISNEQLRSCITELSACITVATAQLLTYVAELDRREAWGDWGVKSCAHWLNWQCGIALGAAREKVRVARALNTLPLINEAFGNGEVSYSKVRAMTRIAEASNEEYLLMIARHGTAAHMESLVRGCRRMKRNEQLAKANQSHENRCLNWFWDEDGSLVINARLPAEAGALVLKAMEAATDEISQQEFDKNVSAETSFEKPKLPAVRADALVNVAEDYLAKPSQKKRSADRYQVVIDIPDADLGNATIQQGPALAQETVERLCCDASIVAIQIDSSGNPLDVGRKQRTIAPALRRALDRRDKGCRFPGCTSHRYVDAHHIKHWAHGGHTKLDNLVLLCRHHHRLIHEGGYQVMYKSAERLEFYTPQGTFIPVAVQSQKPSFTVQELTKLSNKSVSAETLVPNWAGEKMDLGMAVEGVLMGSSIFSPSPLTEVNKPTSR